MSLALCLRKTHINNIHMAAFTIKFSDWDAVITPSTISRPSTFALVVVG